MLGFIAGCQDGPRAIIRVAQLHRMWALSAIHAQTSSLRSLVSELDLWFGVLESLDNLQYYELIGLWLPINWLISRNFPGLLIVLIFIQGCSIDVFTIFHSNISYSHLPPINDILSRIERDMFPFLPAHSQTLMWMAPAFSDLGKSMYTMLFALFKGTHGRWWWRAWRQRENGNGQAPIIQFNVWDNRRQPWCEWQRDLGLTTNTRSSKWWNRQPCFWCFSRRTTLWSIKAIKWHWCFGCTL